VSCRYARRSCLPRCVLCVPYFVPQQPPGLVFCGVCAGREGASLCFAVLSSAGVLWCCAVVDAFGPSPTSDFFPPLNLAKTPGICRLDPLPSAPSGCGPFFFLRARPCRPPMNKTIELLLFYLPPSPPLVSTLRAVPTPFRPPAGCGCVAFAVHCRTHPTQRVLVMVGVSSVSPRVFARRPQWTLSFAPISSRGFCLLGLCAGGPLARLGLPSSLA